MDVFFGASKTDTIQYHHKAGKSWKKKVIYT